MTKILISDKLPYFLTVLFAIMAYLLNQMVSYNIGSPCIIYKFKVLSSKDSAFVVMDNLELEVINLNTNKGFNNLVFDIKYSTDLIQRPAQVFDPELIPIAPASVLPDALVESRHMLINRYHIPKLQPRGKYLMRFKTKHHKEIKDFPKVYLNSSDDIWLADPSLEVFFLKNKFYINLSLLLLCIVSVIYYLSYLNKYKRIANNEM